jgi:hypothetical protein
VVGVVPAVMILLRAVVLDQGIDLIRVAGAFLGFAAQALRIRLPLLSLLAEPFRVDLGLLRLSGRAGGPCFPLACFEILDLGFFPDLVCALVVLAALLLDVGRLALLPEENDQSDDE